MHLMTWLLPFLSELERLVVYQEKKIASWYNHSAPRHGICILYISSILTLKLRAPVCRSRQNVYDLYFRYQISLDLYFPHPHYTWLILSASRLHSIHSLHIRLQLINIPRILIYASTYRSYIGIHVFHSISLQIFFLTK